MTNTNPSPDTRFKPGQSGNPSGRPKGTLKDYDRKKFVEMTDEQKEKFLSKILPETRYKMAEGNPANATDLTTGGEKFNLTVVNYVEHNDPPSISAEAVSATTPPSEPTV